MTVIDVLAVGNAIDRLPFGPATTADFERLNDADDTHRYEVIDGEVRILVPGTWHHQSTTTQLIIWLARTGVDPRCIVPEAGVVITDSDNVIPDLTVSRAPVPAPSPKYLPAADVRLAVEVVSRSSRRHDRTIKPGLYADAGIPHYWRIEDASDDFALGRVEAYHLGDDGYVLDAGCPVKLVDLLTSDRVPFAGW